MSAVPILSLSLVRGVGDGTFGATVGARGGHLVDGIVDIGWLDGHDLAGGPVKGVARGSWLRAVPYRLLSSLCHGDVVLQWGRMPRDAYANIMALILYQVKFNARASKCLATVARIARTSCFDEIGLKQHDHRNNSLTHLSERRDIEFLGRIPVTGTPYLIDEIRLEQEPMA